MRSHMGPDAVADVGLAKSGGITGAFLPRSALHFLIAPVQWAE